MSSYMRPSLLTSKWTGENSERFWAKCSTNMAKAITIMLVRFQLDCRDLVKDRVRIPNVRKHKAVVQRVWIGMTPRKDEATLRNNAPRTHCTNEQGRFVMEVIDFQKSYCQAIDNFILRKYAEFIYDLTFNTPEPRFPSTPDEFPDNTKDA